MGYAKAQRDHTRIQRGGLYRQMSGLGGGAGPAAADRRAGAGL